MPIKNIYRWSFLNALGTVAYIALVVGFMTNSEKWFKDRPEYFAGLTMLLLFVLSAAVASSLVLGRPILWYLNGAKKEAIKLFGFTLAWLFTALCVLLITLFTLK